MKILDVGGTVNPYPKATHIIDVLPKPDNCDKEYIQMDVCNGRWPFEDKEFDFIYCSNLLEDVKDPIHVCNEMSRIAKKGTIIVPSAYIECRMGVDQWPNKDKYAGFIHHRWICFSDADGVLTFMQKTPMTHIYDWTKGISDDEIKKKAFIKVDWEEDIKANEIIYADWNHWYKTLSDFFKTNPKGEE